MLSPPAEPRNPSAIAIRNLRIAGRRVLSPPAALRRTPATDSTPQFQARTRVSALALAPHGPASPGHSGLGLTPTRAYPLHEPSNEEVNTLTPA